MTRISVVMPTISGREESCARMVQAYRDRSPGHDIEIINPKDYNCWPAGCNAGRRLATADVIHFGADDLEPIEGWADAMLDALAHGHVPAPQLWDFAYDPTARPIYEHMDGVPGTIAVFSRVPSLTREMADAVGDWPIMDYYADNWVSDKARVLGWETVNTEGYRFVHHWNQVGRLDKGDWQGRSVPKYNEERAKLGLPPVAR